MKPQMSLNDAYAAFSSSPDYQTENEFGLALMRYCEIGVHKYFGERWRYYEDCVGDAVIKVLQYKDKYNPALSAFETWCTTLIFNVCKDAQSLVQERNEEAIGNPNSERYGHNPFVSLDTKLTIQALLSKLSSEDQELIRLKLEGYEDQEIAKKLGWTKEKVKWHYHEAVENMKQYSEVKMLGEDPISKVGRIGAGLVKVMLEDGREGIIEKAAISTVRVPKRKNIQ